MKTTLHLSAAALLASAAPFVAQAQFNYTTNDSTVIITGYTGSGGDVEVPNTIDGLPVTSIGDEAFAYCTTLTNVTIPNSVTNIGSYGFQSCINLGRVTIPEGVTTIPEGAFSKCTRLTSVIIPDTVERILNSLHVYERGGGWGSGAFESCTSLTNLSMGLGVTEIGAGSFANCANLANVTIGRNVTIIGEGAFCGSGLQYLAIPPSVSSIGAGAFCNCTSLTSINIPNSVTNIDSYGRGYSTALGWRPSPVGEFAYCTSLTNVTIGSGLVGIPAMTFVGCSSLTSVTVAEGVLGIGYWAFAYCTHLRSIILPSSLAYAEYAFIGCDSVTGAYFRGNAPSCTTLGFEAGPNVYYLPGTIGWDTFPYPTAPWVLPYPVILTSSPSFGVQTNSFGFTVSWATNVPVVVEASTSLNNPAWIPVATNTLINGTSYFSDHDQVNHPSRFYRVRAQ
jgi:hypothetical protein